MKEEGIIYLITNLKNHKLYVGQTTETLKSRVLRHSQLANRDGYQTLISKDIARYGIENFLINPIEVVPKSELDEREKHWIHILQTHESQNGYNVTLGGSDGEKVITDDEEIAKVYHECRSLRKTAEKLGYSRDVISHRIQKMGIRFYSASERKGISVMATNGNNTVSLPSKKSMAQWLIEKEVGGTTNLETMRKKIKNGVKIGDYEITIE